MDQKELTNRLAEASRLYYFGANSGMSDHEFDQKVEELRKMEQKSGVVYPGSPTVYVGAKIVSGLETRKHEQPALSLDKVKYADRATLLDWVKEDPEGVVISWKLDGSTVVVTYDNGEMTSAVTRGNGIEGSDITHNARYFHGLPRYIQTGEHVVVRGEAFMEHSEFERINAEEDGAYENARNLATATIQMLDANESRKRKISFKAFELVAPGTDLYIGDDTRSSLDQDFNLQYMSDRLDWLKMLGFDVVDHEHADKTNILQKVEEWKDRIQNLGYPTDGLVFSYEDLAYGWNLGSTGHHPRWAKALKWTDETESTVIRDIEWSVAKTGVITPVAVFDPVRLGLGSTVTRASLHNLSIMKNMPTPDGKREPVRIGARAEVYLANMIIPQIATIQNSFDGGLTCPTQPVQIPDVCPVCGRRTRLSTLTNTNVTTLHCDNRSCPAQTVGKLLNAFSKDGLFVKGLGESQIVDLMDAELVDDTALSFYDLANEDRAHSVNPRDDEFTKKVDTLLKKEGWGMKKWDNLISAIDASRKTTLAKFLYSLNIPLLGNDLSKKLAKQWDNDPMILSELCGYASAYCDEVAQDLMTQDGIGEEKARNVARFFMEVGTDKGRHEAFRHLIDELEFPEPDITPVTICRRLEHLEWEPLDTEGWEMDGTAVYNGREYSFTVNLHHPDTKDPEMEAAKAIFEEIKGDDSGTDKSLAGMTFVITGNVGIYKNRDEFKASVESRGGKVAGSVSKNTTALVNNDIASTSGKNKKAKELGIPIISEADFVEKYGK